MSYEDYKKDAELPFEKWQEKYWNLTYDDYLQIRLLTGQIKVINT